MTVLQELRSGMLWKLTLAGLVMAALSACTSNIDASDVEGSWVPVQGELPSPIPKAAEITFREDGTWEAWDGCSKIVGGWSLDDDQWAAGEQPGMFNGGSQCSQPSVDWLGLLSQSEHVRLVNQRLEVLGSNDDVLLTLESG